MRTLYQDLRFGLRLLLGSPGYATVAIFTLALGIATNTTVFSWVDSILLHPFGNAADTSRLAVFESVTDSAPNGGNMVSYLDYYDYRRNLKSLTGLALHREDVLAIGDEDSPHAVWGELVTGDYFRVLGIKLSGGHGFHAEGDGAPDTDPVAVISDRLWRSQFHADPHTIGKTLRVNRRQLAVVGIAPPDFVGTIPGLQFDVWVPLGLGIDLGFLAPKALQERDDRCFYATARLRAGSSRTQAAAEAAGFARSLQAAYPKTNRGILAAVVPIWQLPSGGPQLLLQPLRILMAIALLVLLIGCVNVANLMLARSIVRRREFSIRLALGASGGRLSRQLLAETLLLSAAGAAVGLLLASWMAGVLPALVPKIGAPVHLGFAVNWRILAFVAVACMLATVVSGVVPAWFRLRSDPNEALKEGGRSGSQGLGTHRTRNLLVVSEVALATLAVIGAGLFLRSFQNARSINPGFDRDHVILARFFPAAAGFAYEDQRRFARELKQRLESSTGVASVAFADYAPLGAAAGPYNRIAIEGYAPALNEPMNVNRYLISPGYFQTLHIPLLEGRDFRDSDTDQAPLVLIVNQTFAQRYFHGGSPLGRKVRMYGKWATIVGMARDSKYFDIAESSRAHFFAPHAQYYAPDQQMYFFIKASRDPAPLMENFGRQVASLDSNAAFNIMPLTEWTDVTLLPQKVAASMLTALGIISLLLAAVGLYSVMAYAVTQRTQEIGIRMALGAQPRDVLADVLWRGAALATAGLVAGVAGALVVSRLVGSMLVHLRAADPVTFAGAILFLSAVALLASYIPARRATRVDPTIALRGE